jgi:hypothetical protein
MTSLFNLYRNHLIAHAIGGGALGVGFCVDRIIYSPRNEQRNYIIGAPFIISITTILEDSLELYQD